MAIPLHNSKPVDFASLGLTTQLVAAVSALGYEEPTPIQREAIPLLLDGRDLIGQAAVRSITLVGATRQILGTAHRTLAAAISRRAITISRLFDSTSGLAPFASCRARFEASITSSKRLETLPKQSSTVILAIASTVRRLVLEHKNNVLREEPGGATGLAHSLSSSH